jgi:hypothetical protein
MEPFTPKRETPPVFEGALVSASSLGLASFFGSIISHVRSYQIQQHHVRISTFHQPAYTSSLPRPFTIHAEHNPYVYKPFDIVFIIDDSGSMVDMALI